MKLLSGRLKTTKKNTWFFTKRAVNLRGLCCKMWYQRNVCLRSKSHQILEVCVDRGWRRGGMFFWSQGVLHDLLWLSKSPFREGKAACDPHLSRSAQSHHVCTALDPGRWQPIESFLFSFCDTFQLLLLIFYYRSVDGYRGLGDRMCHGLGSKCSTDTAELNHQCTFACNMEDWKWWPKQSHLNLYFYSHDPTNAMSFTEVHTRPVLVAKGPFPVLAKCRRTYFLGAAVLQEKVSLFPHPLSTQAVYVLLSMRLA